MPNLGRVVLENVHPEDIDLYWIVMLPHLRMACERVATSTTPGQFYERIKNRSMMGWVIYEIDKPVPTLATAVTSLRETNEGLTSVIEAVGGEHFDAWREPIMAEFERMAKEHGVVRVEIEGRQGWQRKLPGYKVVRVVMEKVL